MGPLVTPSGHPLEIRVVEGVDKFPGVCLALLMSAQLLDEAPAGINRAEIPVVTIVNVQHVIGEIIANLGKNPISAVSGSVHHKVIVLESCTFGRRLIEAPQHTRRGGGAGIVS